MALVATLVAPSSASAAVYWGYYDGLGVVNEDGSLESKFQPNAPVSCCGMAVDSAHRYWTSFSSNTGAIARAGLDGTAVDPAFIGGLGFPSGIAVDGSHIYWADRYTDTVGRASLDGTGIDRSFIDGADYPCGVAVDGSHIYWSNLQANAIGRARLDGSEVEQGFITGATGPCGVAVTSSSVYWTSGPVGAIGRAPIGGGAAENDFIADAGQVFSLAAGPTRLYWTDEGIRNLGSGTDPEQPGAVGRARLDGSEVERRWLPTGIAHGVAVDSRVLTPPPPPPPTPSWYLRFGRLTHERSGTIRLVVFVPGPGEFTVDSPAIGWRIEKESVRPGTAFARWTLRLWPGKGTPTAKRIRHQLGQRGKAPFALHLTYTQEGHLPLQSSKHLAFVSRAKR